MASFAGCASSREIPGTGELAHLNAGPPVHTAAGDECSPYTPGRVFLLTPEVLRYCGLLDQSGYTALKAAMSQAVTTLVITSAGGDGSYSVDIAEIVLGQKLNVEIAGPCLSGCASFVFVAGHVRTVAATGIIGFHNTGSSVALMAEHSGQVSEPGMMAPLWERAMREWRLYAAQGAGLGLLFEPQVRISTLCLIGREARARTGEPVFDLVSTHDVWVPDARQLTAYGVTFRGSLPRSLEEAERRFSGYMQPGSLVPNFVHGGEPLTGRPEQALYQIKPCIQPIPATGARTVSH